MNEAAITDLGTKLDLLTARVNRLEKIIDENLVNKRDYQVPLLPKDKIIEAIMDKLATYDVIVQKTTHTPGNGLVLTNVHGDKLQVSLRDTESLFDDNYEFDTLVSYQQKDIAPYDAFIFCIVDRQSKPQFLIFFIAQFAALLNHKQPSQVVYYFYFDKTWNGDYIDDREKPQIDVSEYYDNWKALIIN